MKLYLEKICISLLRHRIAWKPASFFVKLGGFLKRMRQIALLGEGGDYAFRGQHLWPLFGQPVVLHGPFQGLRYPTFETCGSLLCPKLIGSYEKELQESVETCLRHSYSDVIDIGCAEGYYAVGFAQKLGTAIWAFDTSEKARLACAKMAKTNGVESLVQIGGTCAPEDLEKFSGKRCLVICDCEGYEAHLFSKETIGWFTNSDLIIETHDLYGKEISYPLEELFSPTHHIQRIPSVDDVAKAREYSFPETRALSFGDRFEMFAEGRRCRMDWLVCVSRNAPDNL